MNQDKFILDVCCGSRMFWFDKEEPHTLFTDIRDEELTLCDGRITTIHPDKLEDVTNLSFSDNSFHLVVFDPPHLRWVGENSWMAHKYGKLPHDWEDFINKGVHECMRVLKPYGTLIFKWNEHNVKVSNVIKAISDYKPLFGHITRRNDTTVWMTFMKFPKEEGGEE